MLLFLLHMFATCTLMKSFILSDTIMLGWSIIYSKGSKAKLQCFSEHWIQYIINVQFLSVLKNAAFQTRNSQNICQNTKQGRP